ncbi:MULTISPECIES: cytochrome-c peroxidase [unclassified Campylobacter]|uniref:cytochrome-c peroxidase n=1 Tax=unclassified Campylobacter TaxID=2593542 RepID=UPI003D340404
MRKIILILFFAVFALSDELFVPSLGLKYDESKAQLGKRIFFDKRISPNGTVSCESCHNLYWDFSGTVRTKVHENAINPPSIINAAHNYLYTISGNIRSLKDQIKIALLSHEQLGSSEDLIISVLNKTSDYRTTFKEIYDDSINTNNIVDVLEHFIKAIYTADSPFDRYLLGNKNALSDDQKEGFEIFNKIGCSACHNGVNLGANLRHQADFHRHMMSDEGQDVKNELFRVPPLRNIGRTAPYLHDGSIVLLKDVIERVAKIQLARSLSQDELDKLYKFLMSLSGERPRILK